MSKLTTLLTSIGIGAGLMYFYDPRQGNRRRAMLRDQVISIKNRADDSIDVGVRDLRNRTRGILAETMGRLSEEDAPDWLLEERVRATIGRVVRNPRAIQVSASGGRILLRGPVLADEVDYLIKRTAAVRGVHGVDNQLEVHQDAGDIPALQGASNFRPERLEWNQDNWSPSLRLLTGVGGGLLAVYGALRRGLVGTALSVAGLSLAARGVANIDVRNLVGLGTARDVINVNKAININAAVNEVYQFWQNFENLPKFMQHLKEVRDIGNGRTHWVATGPAGVDVEWDAYTTRQVPNEMIAWESVAGSEIKTNGMVRFDENSDGSTRVTVHLNYTPPAGVIGHAVATLFGTDPKRAMDEDLVRLKALFEEGKTTVGGKTVKRGDLKE